MTKKREIKAALENLNKQTVQILTARRLSNLAPWDVRHMNYAKAYAKIAKETAAPRELEATLLLNAAARLKAVYDSWKTISRASLDEAVTYNRKLWTVLIDSLNRHDSHLPADVRNNLLRLGVYVLAECYSLTTRPDPLHLQNIIKINRGIATGLRKKA